MKIKVRPITTLLVTTLILTGTYGLGILTAFLASVPYVKDYIPSPKPITTPAPTAYPWKETAYSGVLRYSVITQKYYLSTSTSEAITLEVPPTVDVAKLVGKKIFAVGKYNKTTDILIVADISSLVILPASSQPIPTFSPSPLSSPINKVTN